MTDTKMTRKPETAGSIVFYARDPGGADAIFALLRAWDDVCAAHPKVAALTPGNKAPEVHQLVVKDTAIAAAAQVGLEAIALPDVYGTGPHETGNAMAMLEKLSAQLLVSATNDIDDPTYLDIWRAARAQGIPIIAVLDDPASLTYRFRTTSADAFLWPDICLAADAETRHAVLELGIPDPDSILITGDLHLAAVIAQSRDVPPASRERLRSCWRVAEETSVILFASSAFAEMRAQGRENVGDEHALIRSWIHALESGWRPAGFHSTNNAVIIRPHPRDFANKYDSWKQEEPFPVRVSAAGSAVEVILAADLIAGTSPAMLRIATALGKSAMSNPQQQIGSLNVVSNHV